MEIKDIRPYLPLYLGAKFRYKYIDSDGWTLWSDLLHYRLSRMDDASISEIQLLLRPLNDMTEEEFREFVLISNPEQNFIKEHTKEAMDSIRQEGTKAFSFDDVAAAKVFELTRFLLSKHFDLFGLIPAGLALDKTKLNQ